MESERREFIKKSLAGVLALLGLGLLVPGLKVCAPFKTGDTQLEFFPLMPEDDLPRAGVKKAELVFSVGGRSRKTRVFVVSSSDGISVLSATCSHLGCLVNYSREKGEFVCPCHGGRYDLKGKNIAGPPPAPLAMLPHRVQNGMLMVGVRA
jgi:cytochrome b6-f complex iron-sulfur subunit